MRILLIAVSAARGGVDVSYYLYRYCYGFGARFCLYNTYQNLKLLVWLPMKHKFHICYMFLLKNDNYTRMKLNKVCKVTLIIIKMLVLLSSSKVPLITISVINRGSPDNLYVLLILTLLLMATRY